MRRREKRRCSPPSIQPFEPLMADRSFEQFIDRPTRFALLDQGKDRIQRFEIPIHHGLGVLGADIYLGGGEDALLQHFLSDQGLVFAHIRYWQREAYQSGQSTQLQW